MSRKISKVAVLGSGVMGSGIAAHLAGTGHEVLLLDIVPFTLTDEEKKIPAKRNSLVNDALNKALNAKPAAFYDKKLVSRITTGNFDDDMAKIADADWIIEVVVERLDIKQQVFEKVEKFRKPGALVTSNTSGIPIHLMAEGRSEDFRKHFCGTHFFNPPRYLKLLEIIPTTETSQEVIDFFMHYGDKFLGKTTVLCKDTPAFIANRVGVYAMAKVYQLTTELGLRIEDVDKLTGSPMGRPNTGTFRLGDLVGHDTSAHVIKGIKDNCPNDEQAGALVVPSYMTFLVENKFLGDKTGQGFYKKTAEKGPDGKNIILALNLTTNEYEPQQKTKFPSMDAVKQVDALGGKIRTFFKHDDAGAQLVKKSLLGLWAYVSNRVPEISDNLYSIDDALRAGFAWEAGPFQYWDFIGVKEGAELAKAEGYTLGAWVDDLLAAGHNSFYKVEHGKQLYWDVPAKAYLPVPGADQFIVLDRIRENSIVWKNDESSLHDIGDGVLCFEFQSKANSLGEGVMTGLNKAIDIAESGEWRGLVIGNNAPNFSVGANLMAVAMMAYSGEWDELRMSVKAFQDTVMRCRYSSIPVVAATQGYAFGGACEMAMHCDSAIVAAETYMGLVEVGVGILPGGGGTKEFALRASDSFFEGDVQIPTIIERFKTIATASVGTSANEAFNYGYLQKGRDRVSFSTARNIGEAKNRVLELAAAGYVKPIERTDILVLGRTGLGALYTAAESLRLGNYASEHDLKIAKKIAYVLCGGDLSMATKVSEQYLLELEREAFMSLCGEPKTLERIQYMLTNNKPLRN